MSVVHTWTRRVIQITTVVIHETDGGALEWDSINTTALCNDGTIWRHEGGTDWRRLPNIPQGAAE